MRLTIRGWGTLGAGFALYVVSRMLGSPNLHMVAVGVMALPLLALAFLHFAPRRIHVKRRPAATRAFPGTRIRVDLSLTNGGRVWTPLILLEDTVPSALGRAARAVLPGIPGGNDQTVSYLVPCRSRGRYPLGPARLLLSDPWGLARARVEDPHRDELIVYPEVEELAPWPLSSFGSGAGDSLAHQLFRSGEEFYGMREYITGDDLRRIHWPSTAATGKLMIRQDEAARRSTGTLFLDTRAAALGGPGSAAFERAVSVAASLAVLFARGGFTLRLATPDLAPTPASQDQMLEHLASVVPSRTVALHPALTLLRRSTVPDSTLLVITAPPAGNDVPALIRAGSGYGRTIAVLVYLVDPASLPVDRGSELEGRASVARASLSRAGWDVFVIRPDQGLGSVWQSRKSRTRPVAASS